MRGVAVGAGLVGVAALVASDLALALAVGAVVVWIVGALVKNERATRRRAEAHAFSFGPEDPRRG